MISFFLTQKLNCWLGSITTKTTRNKMQSKKNGSTNIQQKHPEIPKINVSAGYCILLQPTNCLLSIFHFSDFYSTSVLSLARLILSDIWLSALSVLHVINCLRFPFVSHWKHLILFTITRQAENGQTNVKDGKISFCSTKSVENLFMRICNILE